MAIYLVPAASTISPHATPRQSQPSTPSLRQSLTKNPTYHPHIHLRSTRLTPSTHCTELTSTLLPTYLRYVTPTINQCLRQSLPTRIPKFQSHIHLRSTRLTPSTHCTEFTSTLLPTHLRYVTPTINQCLRQSLPTRIPKFQSLIHLRSTRLTSRFRYTRVGATPVIRFHTTLRQPSTQSLHQSLPTRLLMYNPHIHLHKNR